jgi:hypothetical protein
MRKINIKKDRIEIKGIIMRNLDLMVQKKNNKGIIINEPMTQNIADCIIAYLVGAI